MTAQALKALDPAGLGPPRTARRRSGWAPAGGPGGLRVTSLAGADPYTLAHNIDDYRSRVAGRPSAAVIVVPPTAPSTRCRPPPGRRSPGDPVLFTAARHAPGPDPRGDSRARPSAHLRARPAGAVSAGVEAQLAQLGTVTRIAAADAPQHRDRVRALPRRARSAGASSIPGHGFVFASPRRPQRRRRRGAAVGQRHVRAAAADRRRRRPAGAPCRTTCSTSSPATPATRCAAFTITAGSSATTRAVGVAAQATIDGLLEIAPVNPAKRPVSEAEDPHPQQPPRRSPSRTSASCCGASTPHFALQLRNRIARLIARPARRPPRAPARRAGDGAAEIARLRRRAARPPRRAGARRRSRR